MLFRSINDKLEKIQQFNKDGLNIQSEIDKIDTLLDDLKESTEISNDTVEEMIKYKSKYNSEIFDEINESLKRIKIQIQAFEQIKVNIATEILKLNEINTQFIKKKEGFIDEFEKIKREINEEDLSPDSYLKLTQSQTQLEELIKNLEGKLKNIDSIKLRLMNNLKTRRDLIIKVNLIYKERISKINESQDNIKITFMASGNKEKFVEDMKNFVRGSGLRGEVINRIEDDFVDYIGILEDIYLNEANILKTKLKESEIEKINEVLKGKLNNACTYLPENQVEIKYHDKLLKNHSLGQRASAIILFILAQKENDLIIIDQPEDDLDNQVIYKELISTIKNKKENIQFIFSTHNANIPVLGDAEQVICIKDDGQTININNNSIDNKDIQKDIVQIMEGGPEAFNRRKQIYKEWRINSSD